VTLRHVLREWAPPALLRKYRRLRGDSIRFSGDYSTWQQCQAASRGYDDSLILEQVKRAMLRVRNGEGACERDGIVLSACEPNFPLLAALEYVALAAGRLRVLDFGGSLGGTYHQVRKLIPESVDLSWEVVEQAGFVECGIRNFADAHLRFHLTIDDAIAAGKPNIVLLSSVLPYLEQPYETLAQIVNAGCEFILLDRTPVLRAADRDRLTVQQIRLPEYHASYPAWFFAKSRLMAAFSPIYHAVFLFDSFESWEVDGTMSQSIGGLFRKVTA
jgi:putative methyltransferase (TIGR04325 family)